MAETDHPANNIDVAMFVDWENMHGGISGKANISALREVAESYGRLVVAKAYADWREHRFQQDSLVLYKIGVEPIYVPHAPATGKNNVDVKLATDCIDFAHRYPNIGVCLLVTGDGDFIHVASALRPLGKKVVIAQSYNASSRFGELVDTLLIYEQDVNPISTPLPTQLPRARRMKKPQALEEVYQEIAKILHEEEGTPILSAHIKQKLIRTYGGFDQSDYGFIKFKAMIEAGAQAGYFTLNTAGLRDWLTLPRENNTQADGHELPDEIDELFQEIVTMIRSSSQSKILLTYVKQSLIKKYGGFDEAVYGYNRLKEMMQEGERLGYFIIGKNDKELDYVFLKEKEEGKY